MRVTTGTAKGRKLISVPDEGTRPITDRAKQALFNILGDDVRDSVWLDLFGGTGAVGIEALSRGARSATFVDTAPAAVKAMQANVKTLGFERQARVLRQDAFAYIEAHPNQRYDFVYVAPPQFKGLWLRALTTIDQNTGWLTPTGTVICQIAPSEYAEVDLDALELTDERKYGRTLLCFYDRKDVDNENH